MQGEAIMTEVCTPADVLRTRNTRIRTCKRCKFATSNAKDFLQHQMKAHGGGSENEQDSTTFDCDECDYICISQAELLKHRNRMHSTRSKRTSTDDEQPGTPTSEEMEEFNHDMASDAMMSDDRSDEDQMVKMGVTLPTRTYTCSHCRWSTTSSRGHLYHLVEDHGYDYTIYECDLCDYATRYKQKLPRHRRCHFTSPTDSPKMKSPVHPGQSQPVHRRKNSHPESVRGNDFEIQEGVDDYDTAEEVDMTEYWKSDENEETESQVSSEMKLAAKDINENLKASLNRPPYNAADTIVEQTSSPVLSLEKPTQEDHSGKSANNDSMMLESKLGSKVEVTASSPTSILAESVAKWQGSAVNMNDSLLQYDDPPALVIDDTPTTPTSVTTPVLPPQPQPPPKTTPEKKKNGAPIREAVDPAKYIRVQDVDGIKFACSKCGNIYKWRKSLNKHWKEKHDGEIPVPISTSGAAFTMLNVPRLAAAAASNRLIALPHVTKASRSKPSYTSPIKTNGLINDSPTMVSNAYPTMKDTFPRSHDTFSMLGKNSYSSLSDSYPTMKNLFSKELAYKPPTLDVAQSTSLAKTAWHMPDTSKWGMNEIKSTAMKRSLSPSMTTHPHSRPQTPVHLGPAHSYKRDVSRPPSVGMTQPPVSYKQSTSPYSNVIPPAAHSHGLPTTPQVCDAVPLDLSQHPSVKDEPVDDDVLDLSKPSGSSKLFNTSVDSAIDFSVRPSGKSESAAKSEPNDGSNKRRSIVWECYKCSFVAHSPEEYENHRHVHKAEVYRCTVCELHFVTIYELNIHFRKHHDDILFQKKQEDGLINDDESSTKLACIVCGESVTQANHLWKHFTEAHQGLTNPYERYQSNDETNEPDTKRLKLENGGDMSCSQCSFTARDNEELSRHHLIHALNRPFACSLCGYSTRWKHDLQQHVRRYHENRTPSPAPSEPSTSESPTSSVEKQTYLRQLGLYSKGDEPEDIASQMASNGRMSEGSASPDSVSTSRRVRGKMGTSSAEMLLPYKCTVCEYRARWPSEIAQHMKNHSDEKPFACPRCTYKSKWKWDVVKHLKRCGGGTVNDVIDTTKVGKKGQLAGPAWMKAVQFKEQSPTGARGLSSGPPNVTVMASMLKTNDAPSVGITKMDDSALVSHLHEVQYNSVNASLQDKRHHCLQCPFVGESLVELKRHQREHSLEKPFACGTCGYCSKWKCDLKKHLRTYNHTADSIIDVNDSEHESATDDDVMMADEDTRKSLYKCDKCQYVTYKKAQLDIHMKIHRGDRASGGIRCKQCDFEADDISSFLQHKLTHRADSREGSVDKESGSAPSRNRRKPQKQFRCPKCPFSSCHREQIDLHFQSHQADGKFECAYCDYHADDSDLLDAHQKVHPEYFNSAMDTSPDEDEEDCTLNLSGKPYQAARKFQFKCEWCEFSVNRADLLLKHVKVSHPRELAEKEKLVKMCETTGQNFNGVRKAPQRRRRMKTRYQCRKCHYATFDCTRLARHYHLHFITSKYSRKPVARATFKLANQSQHAIVHGNNNAIIDNNNLSMKLSKKSSESLMNGSLHFQLITNEKIHRFKCLACPYHTYSESLLTNHMPRHKR